MEGGRSSLTSLINRTIGKGPLRRSMRRLEDNIRVGIKEIAANATN